ncbi:hypothetical protein RvY_11560 [Ramazzottius varieornatus]|uniref:Uncharacterized protein n=1 Tax=Ramazzottius varieornatus TaxID=947166 RepID=A0A1D1VLX7_RAMVA|nr:hypothetical protein RvY_11560 [Ramazzottius varieornatus]
MALGTAASSQHAQPETAQASSVAPPGDKKPESCERRSGPDTSTCDKEWETIAGVFAQPEKVPLCVPGFEDMDCQQDTFLITRNDDAQWNDVDQVDVEDGNEIISENSPDEAVWENTEQIISKDTLTSDELEAMDTMDDQQDPAPAIDRRWGKFVWNTEKEDGLYNDFITNHASCGLRCHLTISIELHQGRRRTMKEMSRHERRLCLASMLSMALPAVFEKGSYAK